MADGAGGDLVDGEGGLGDDIEGGPDNDIEGGLDDEAAVLAVVALFGAGGEVECNCR